MKKILILLFISCFLGNAYASANRSFGPITGADTATVPFSQLAQINTNNYIGLSINQFLADLDNLAPGYVLSRVYGLDGRRLATRLTVFYTNGLAFTIVVKKTEYVTQYNEDSQWPLDQFRQEKISRIEFYKNDLCVSGCL